VVVDTRKQDDIYSHGFSRAFSKKVIGVINVIEGDVSHYKDAVRTLKQIGVNEPYFEVNLANGYGVEELIKFLDLDDLVNYYGVDKKELLDRFSNDGYEYVEGENQFKKI